VDAEIVATPTGSAIELGNRGQISSNPAVLMIARQRSMSK
jgi:hypothetical protein